VSIASYAPKVTGRRIVVDPDLPQLGRMLDPADIAGVLQGSLPESAPPDVHIVHLRYRPRRNLTVHYEVHLDGQGHHAFAFASAKANLARRASKPEHLALASLVDGRSPAIRPLAYDSELGALIQWYPLDIWLPALAEPPERLRSRVRAAGVRLGPGSDELGYLNYKPGRRAVLQLDDHVVKIYGSERDFESAATGLRAATAIQLVRSAEFETALPELRLTVQTRLPGSPPESSAEWAREVGETLVAVHSAQLHPSLASRLPRRGPEQELEAAAKPARLLGIIAPELHPRIEALLSRLEETMPQVDRLVPSHGDCHSRQLRHISGDLALIDFDDMCKAPPALDLATYAANVVRGEPGDLASAERVLELTCDGYGQKPEGLRWYFAISILRRAHFPFRHLDERWDALVEAMVGAAEEVSAG
jgi:hypothetical protein